MICKDCAWEADAVKRGDTTHARVAEVNERLPAAMVGHSACLGCDCHHQEVTADVRET